MMNLHSLTKTTKKRKTVGRGNSSKGTFSGRGMKGQGQRKSPHAKRGLEGGQMPFIQRMPKYRGFKSPNKIFHQIVKLNKLENIKSGETLTLELLKSNNLISNLKTPAKIVGVRDYNTKSTYKLGKNVFCTKSLNDVFSLS